MKLHSSRRLLMLLTGFLFLAACQKDATNLSPSDEITGAAHSTHGHLKQTKTFSSDVATRWLNLQLNFLRVPLSPGAGSQASDRALLYCGAALYETVVGGMPAYRSLAGQLNTFPQMPATEPGKAYHWAAAANATLAAMNRNLFPTTSAANLESITTLENTLQEQYSMEADAATIERSIALGRAVAVRVFEWAQSDGTSLMPAASTYVLPVGPGLWEKTPPGFGLPANPFLHMRRVLVPGSETGTTPTPPPPFSTLPTSAFYAMVKNVYDKSFTLSGTDSAAALYHRDAPGYPGGGSMVAMLAQIIEQKGNSLDQTAEAYVKVGMGSFESLRLCFITKYAQNQLRPITYIHSVMGHTTWAPLFATPAHPEFPAAHGTNGGAFSAMLNSVFGTDFPFVLDHYGYLGLAPHSYANFDALGSEMANGRVFGGIHYQHSVDEALKLGRKVTANMLARVKFKK
jgi:hypothetical protein